MARPRRDNLWTYSAWAILVGPYLYYGWFSFSKLNPVAYPDSFAYLWRQPLNIHYFTGRSLTQRFLFSLCGNNLGLIAGVQLALYAASTIALYLLLRPRERGWRDPGIALVIALIFSSYTFNLSAVAVCAEPVFLALLLVTPCLIISHEERAPALVIAVGTLFIFSKNLAPAIVLMAIVCRFASLTSRPKCSLWLTHGALAVISCASLLITARYDTSVDLNTANNMFVRVFPYAQVAEHFQEQYGMPQGDYVQACGGEFITAPCFAGRTILTIDQQTQNYDLLEDDFGFVPWVRSTGRSAYLRYLFLDRPYVTYRELRTAFARHAGNETIRFMTFYLGKDIPQNTPNNLDVIASDPARAVGFMGFDALVIMEKTLVALGLAHPEVVLLLAALGIVLARAIPEPGHLALASSGLGLSLLLFFGALFGDGFEVSRHVFPALLLMTCSGMLYVLSLGNIFGHVWSRSKGSTTKASDALC